MRLSGAVFFCVAVLLVAGAGRLAYLAQVEGPALGARARRQQTVTLTIPARRGDILDTKGRLLAGSLRRPSVFADPKLLETQRDVRYAASCVAPVLGLRVGELETLLSERPESRFVWVRRRISEEQLAAFKAVRDGRRLNAFGVQNEFERTYPYGRLAAHVLGFVGDPREGVVARSGRSRAGV